MADLDDLPLERTPPTSPSARPAPPAGGTPLVPVAVVAGLILTFLLGGAWWLSRQPERAAPLSQAVATTDVAIPTPPPAAELPPDLPALDQMDPFLRTLVGALSTRPELARWLATDDLIRQLASAVDKTSQGRSPARDFRTLAPAEPFRITGRGSRRAIDPASYRRYDGLVTAITSTDASAVARAYRTIRPRLNEAYRGMGHPNGDVDRAVQDALALLLDTPVLRDPIAVVEGQGARWAYADPAIEALDPAQKQLLRMGPDHVDAVLIWLRALQEELLRVKS